MASVQSSFFLYKGTQEWKLNDPRDCFEIGYVSGYPLNKTSPEVEFTVPLDNVAKSHPIYWYVRLYCKGNTVDGKPAFDIYVHTNTKGCAIDNCIGLKLSLIILDDSNNVLCEKKGYAGLTSGSAINTTIFTWNVKTEDIPQDCPFIKICSTYQAYDWKTGIVPPSTSPAQAQVVAAGPCQEAQTQYGEMMIEVLDKDRKTGVSTDAVLKQGEAEFKVHKCVLSLQSDFFKACFSDRWDSKDGDPRVVDMNDSELSPELLEALISGAYTGKVEDFDTAVKILPLADKYQFQTLKGVCEQFISGQLTRENVLDVYMLANQCSALTLQEKCKVLIKM